MNREIDKKVLIIGAVVILTTACAWLENPGLGVFLLLVWIGLLLVGARHYIGEALIGAADRAPAGSERATSLYMTAARLIQSAIPRKPRPQSLRWVGLLAAAWASSGVESVDGVPLNDYIVGLLEPYGPWLEPKDPGSQLILFRLAEANYHLGAYAQAYAVATRAPLRMHNLNQGFLLHLLWVKAMSALALNRHDEAAGDLARMYANNASFWGVGVLGDAIAEAGGA